MKPTVENLLAGKINILDLPKRIRKKMFNRLINERTSYIEDRHDRSMERLLRRAKYAPRADHYLGAADVSFLDL